MGREGINGQMGRATNGEVLAFGGIEVYLSIFGPTGAGVWGALWKVRAVTGDDDFDVIYIGEAVCRQVVGEVTDVDGK